MPLSFIKNWKIAKSRLFFLSLSAIIIAAVIAGFFLLRGQLVSSSEQLRGAQEYSKTANIGIVYLPVTPSVSTYYGLGVDSGALVTQVITDSPADKAGLNVGDVILSFNGVSVGEEESLLGMIRSCPEGKAIVLEVCRGKSHQNIELVYIK